MADIGQIGIIEAENLGAMLEAIFVMFIVLRGTRVLKKHAKLQVTCKVNVIESTFAIS